MPFAIPLFHISPLPAIVPVLYAPVYISEPPKFSPETIETAAKSKRSHSSFARVPGDKELELNPFASKPIFPHRSPFDRHRTPKEPQPQPQPKQPQPKPSFRKWYRIHRQEKLTHSKSQACSASSKGNQTATTEKHSTSSVGRWVRARTVSFGRRISMAKKSRSR